jgi:hypothetical protein
MKADSTCAFLAAVPFVCSANATDPIQPVSPAPQHRANAGRPVRQASTGHVTNDDEAQIGSYSLPDPLVLGNGQPVRDAETWSRIRRPEILELYRRFIYRRVPERTPKATVSIESNDPSALGGTAVRRVTILQFGEGPDAPFARLVIYLPTAAPEGSRSCFTSPSTEMSRF